MAKRQQTGHVLWLLSEAGFYRTSLRRGTLGDASDTQHRVSLQMYCSQVHTGSLYKN